MILRRATNSWRDVAVTLLLLLSLQQGGGAALITFKAWLAPRLIERAWQDTLAASATPVKPWPWADTWPVAKLRVPAIGVTLPVLAGDSGSVLAFAPGHASWSALPGQGGLSMIGGHRDTHFAFLRELSPGVLLQVQRADGAWHSYEVVSMRVVDSRSSAAPADSRADVMQLVTCYPFDALRAGGPFRYVVEALPRSDGEGRLLL